MQNSQKQIDQTVITLNIKFSNDELDYWTKKFDKRTEKHTGSIRQKHFQKKHTLGKFRQRIKLEGPEQVVSWK